MMAAGDFEIRSLSSDYTFEYDDNSSVSSGSYSPTTAPICQMCSQSPCICSNYAPAKGQWSSATVTIQGSPVATPEAEILEKLKVCIVCGAEDSVVLCTVCIEAVKLARNRWLDDYRREIESLGSD